MEKFSPEPSERDKKTFSRRDFLKMTGAAATGAAAAALSRVIPEDLVEMAERDASSAAAEKPATADQAESTAAEKEALRVAEKKAITRIIPPGVREKVHFLGDSDGRPSFVEMQNCFYMHTSKPAGLWVNLESLQRVGFLANPLPEENLLYVGPSRNTISEERVPLRVFTNYIEGEDKWTTVINVEVFEDDPEFDDNFCINVGAFFGFRNPTSAKIYWEKNPQKAKDEVVPDQINRSDMGYSFATAALIKFGIDMSYEEYQGKRERFSNLVADKTVAPALVSADQYRVLKRNIGDKELPIKMTPVPSRREGGKVHA